MKLEILNDYEALSARAAELVAGIVRAKPDAVLCLASGHTPIGLFKQLAALSKAGQIDLGHCKFIGLDEWVGIPPEEAGSCCYFLDVNLFKPLDIAADQCFFFNGMAKDLEDECRQMDAAIARLGGLDLMVVGIGMNGHIALNEPGTLWNLYSQVSDLDATTVQVGQKYFTKKTQLAKGLTLGLRHLREARLPLLLAAGEGKARIVKQALQGNPSEALPASIFQTLEQGVILLDRAAAAELK
ncbi:MAG: glucosamine-6-phosphate deaminase [Lewinellaceae bacterium]|nr:glucosamine-6-phosphate deaminase [Lewinellaceae bacterium]